MVARELHPCTVDPDEMADLGSHLLCPVFARVRPRELQEPPSGFFDETYPKLRSRASWLTNVPRVYDIYDGVGILLHSGYDWRGCSLAPTPPTGAQAL